MKIKKKEIMDFESPYTVSKIKDNDEISLIVATEEKGPTYVVSPPSWEPSLAWDGPGGVMGIEQIDSEIPSAVFVAEFYAGFRSETSYIGLAQANNGINNKWDTSKKVLLPFVHRITVVKVEDQDVIVAATVCESKDFPEDWSKPGDIYIIPIPKNKNDLWEKTKLNCPIKKNHGLFNRVNSNSQKVYFSGEEGIFELVVPKKINDPWEIKNIFKKEVSDLFFYDVDSDGKDELLTIEKFHGKTFNVYKNLDAENKMFSAKLDFGHVIWGGMLNGIHGIITGSRKSEKDLNFYYYENNIWKKINLDKGSGAAQIEVINDKDKDLIFITSNAIDKVEMLEINNE